MKSSIKNFRRFMRKQKDERIFRIKTKMQQPLHAPTSADREKPLPIFLISFNRGRVLQETIESLRIQERPIDIIVNDFGSDNSETTRVLDDLEQNGICIYRREKIKSADELNSVDDVVQDHMQRIGEMRNYAVSDCDINFATSSSNSITIFEKLLDRFSHVDCVGPMLRISDIPRDYPLYERVMNRHIEQFWRQRPVWVSLDEQRVPCLPSPFDTTFAIHRAGSSFKRFKKGLRLYAPYDAMHMDWYLTEDSFWKSEYLNSSDENISHWNNGQSWENAKGETLRYSKYFDVDWSSGRGKTVRRQI